MRKNFYIHAFLIVALCAAQTVSAIHIVGHFHAVSSEAEHHSAVHVHHAGPVNFAQATKAAHEHESVFHSHDKADVDNDCSAYHAYINLCWMLRQSTGPALVTANDSPTLQLGTSIHKRSLLEQARIRAPPIVS